MNDTKSAIAAHREAREKLRARRSELERELRAISLVLRSGRATNKVSAAGSRSELSKPLIEYMTKKGGPVTRRELLELFQGRPFDVTLGRLIRAGTVLRAAPGVYIIPETDDAEG